MNEAQQPLRKPLWQRINKLFLFLVVIPTLVSGLYFGLIASDVYVSQSKFVIYNPQTPSPSTGLGGLLQGVGLGNNSSYAANAVHDYLLSRDALQDLATTLHYRNMVSRKSVDPFNRFGGWIWFDTTFEQLYRYYRQMIGDDINTTTNVSTLTVRAYTSTDATEVNRELLTLAQNLVNRLNQRANTETVDFYMREVRTAEKRVQDSAQAIANYRNQSKVFNPTPEAELQAHLISKLQSERIATQLQLGQLQLTAPTNPKVRALKQNIHNIEKQITKESAQIAGNTTSLASRNTEYERLRLKQAFAEKELASALTSLEQSRVQAEKRQLYIETIVKPNQPDEALQPRRLRGVLATFTAGILLWAVFTVVVAGIREHHER